jgi:hypothetical protein
MLLVKRGGACLNEGQDLAFANKFDSRQCNSDPRRMYHRWPDSKDPKYMQHLDYAIPGHLLSFDQRVFLHRNRQLAPSHDLLMDMPFLASLA